MNEPVCFVNVCYRSSIQLCDCLSVWYSVFVYVKEGNWLLKLSLYACERGEGSKVKVQKR